MLSLEKIVQAWHWYKPWTSSLPCQCPTKKATEAIWFCLNLRYCQHFGQCLLQTAQVRACFTQLGSKPDLSWTSFHSCNLWKNLPDNQDSNLWPPAYHGNTKTEVLRPPDLRTATYINGCFNFSLTSHTGGMCLQENKQLFL